MTEHELFTYRRLVSDRNAILEQIAEFEGRRGSPPGVNMSPFPPIHADPAESFARAADYHTTLLKRLNKVNEDLDTAANMIFLLRRCFEHDALIQRFIEKAYLSGVPYGAIHKVLNVGRSTVYRMRKTVLSEAKKMN